MFTAGDQPGQSLPQRAEMSRAGAAMLAGIDVPAGCTQAQSAATQSGTVNALGGSFEVRDLARTHGPDFPVFPGLDPLGIDVNTTVEKVGLNFKILRYRGYVGTHLAAPFDASNDRRPRREFP